MEIFKEKNANEIENLRKSILTFFQNYSITVKELKEAVSLETGLTWEYFKTLRKKKNPKEIQDILEFFKKNIEKIKLLQENGQSKHSGYELERDCLTETTFTWKEVTKWYWDHSQNKKKITGFMEIQNLIPNFRKPKPGNEKTGPKKRSLMASKL